MKRNKNGFTLLEMLVVVLIIGILAGIALPQYRESVEKSIIQEAAINLRAIANANERFYMINGRYAQYNEIDKLDIEIPGEIKGHSQTGVVGNRIATKHFLYSPNFGGPDWAKAVSVRIKNLDNEEGKYAYELYISKSTNKFTCSSSGYNANDVQRKLCTKIYNTGEI